MRRETACVVYSEKKNKKRLREIHKALGWQFKKISTQVFKANLENVDVMLAQSKTIFTKGTRQAFLKSEIVLHKLTILLN